MLQEVEVKTMMKVTGYKLQGTLRELTARKDVLSAQFEDSRFVFADENKPSPVALGEQMLHLERQIASLQTVQSAYNLQVVVLVQGSPMTLAEAVKTVGGAGRIEKLWRSYAKSTGSDDRYMRNSLTRSKEDEKASRAVSHEEAAAIAKTSGQFASALREAIQLGNAKELEFELDEALFQ